MDARYEYCRRCGQKWNVSRLARLPEDGYICPLCAERTRRAVADSIAQRLLDCRVAKRLSQQTAAELCGMSRQSLLFYERGSCAPRADTLAVLADLYGVSVDWLMGRG